MATPPDAHPVWFTPFIGREREVGQLEALLQHADIRVVTLTGPGGVGKTRLAFGTAERSAQARGQRLVTVDLCPVTDPGLVLPAIAQRLGVRETGRDVLERQVAEALQHEPTLLLLDNFEQVIEAAPLLARLLRASAGLQILVTSRERLRLSAEYAFEVPPLTLPSESSRGLTEALTKSDAIRLFVQRATAARRDFALTEQNASSVAAICMHLDGIPLAIELAAACVNVLPPAAIQARLASTLPLLISGERDMPARHQTMRDTIAWSYDLLASEDRALFRQLSIFAGGFTLPAAEAIAPSVAVVNGVRSLVNKSFLRPEEGTDGRARFRMLETVREFGLEQLALAGELQDVRARHAAFYLTLAEARDPTIPIPGDFDWIARLLPEQGNLRLALTSLRDAKDWRRLLRLTVALDDFWQITGQYAEARQWLMLALERDRDPPVELHAAALAALGQIAYFRGDYAASRSFWEEELALARSARLDYAAADKLARLGALAGRTGEPDRAADLLTEAHAWFGRLDPAGTPALRMIGRTLDLLGDTAILQDKLDLAAGYYEQAVEHLRASNDTWMLVDALGGLGVTDLMRGDPVRAGVFYLEALEIGMIDGNLQHDTSIRAGLGAVAAALGQPERAARLLGAAADLRDRLGAVVYPRDQAVLDYCLSLLHDEFGQPRLAELMAEGRSLGPEQVLIEARAIAPIDPRVSAGLVSDGGASSLTPRELDVLRLLVEGRSDAQIGDALFISRRTVTTHTSNIFEKLGVTGRTEAAAVAVRQGIV